MSKIHLESLPPQRLDVLKRLAHFRDCGYLAGGTALALQMNHRESVDFDVFTPKQIEKGFFKRCREIFGENLEVLINTPEQLTFLTPEKTNITFVFYEYKNLFPFIKTSWINLAFFKDIAADKAQTIGRRAVWRDYVDIFFLLKRKKTTLEEIINLAKKKFKGEFNENLFLEQLVYFKDLEIVPIKFLQESFDDKETKKFLEEEVKKYLKGVFESKR